MSRRTHGEVTVASWLEAPPEIVWARVSTVAGVNFELRPIARMTAPRGVDSLADVDVALGARLFRSWILLFGLVPIDYDDLTLVRLEPGRGFHERSSMLSQRVWEHERTLAADGAGCRVTDRLRFEPRPPIPATAVERVVRLLFQHRHRRLRTMLGARPT